MARELWLSEDKARWVAALGKYDDAIAALAKEKKKPGLVALDVWWRKELPALLQKREAEKGGAYLESKDLERVMEWKLTRGKFRPLMGKIRANDPNKVESCSRRAFALLRPSKDSPSTGVRAAVEAVAELGGVGPATASAILAAYRPSCVCFMEDAAMEALWPGQPMAYTLPQYMGLQAALTDKDAQLGGALGGAERVGQALWAAHTAHKLGLEGPQTHEPSGKSVGAPATASTSAEERVVGSAKKHHQEEEEEQKGKAAQQGKAKRRRKE